MNWGSHKYGTINTDTIITTIITKSWQYFFLIDKTLTRLPWYLEKHTQSIYPSHRPLSPHSQWCMAIQHQNPRLSSRSKHITTLWLVPNYTAWRLNTRVSNLLHETELTEVKTMKKLYLLARTLINCRQFTKHEHLNILVTKSSVSEQKCAAHTLHSLQFDVTGDKVVKFHVSISVTVSSHHSFQCPLTCSHA